MDVYRRLDVKFDLALDTQQALDHLGEKTYDLIISEIILMGRESEGVKKIDEMKRKFADLPPLQK